MVGAPAKKKSAFAKAASIPARRQSENAGPRLFGFFFDAATHLGDFFQFFELSTKAALLKRHFTLYDLRQFMIFDLPSPFCHSFSDPIAAPGLRQCVHEHMLALLQAHLRARRALPTIIPRNLNLNLLSFLFLSLRVTSTPDADTFEKYRYTPPISMAILLQKHALFWQQVVTPRGVYKLRSFYKLNGLLCGNPRERRERFKLNFWLPDSL